MTTQLPRVISVLPLLLALAANTGCMTIGGAAPGSMPAAHETAFLGKGTSIGLIVERVGEGGHRSPIDIEEWKRLIMESHDLRLRSEPYVAVNPRTGERITAKAGEADSEMLVGGAWIPFLKFRGGELYTRYREAFEDPSNPFRVKIAEIARKLNAVITTDAGPGILEW